MRNFLNYLLNIPWILSIVMLFLSEQTKERILIARLRCHFAFFGHDTSHMTDQEIKQGLLLVSKKLAYVGLSAKQAGEAFIKMKT